MERDLPAHALASTRHQRHAPAKIKDVAHRRFQPIILAQFCGLQTATLL
jgi:hypothetical protein